MTNLPTHLVDQSSARVASLSVAPSGDLYSGTISLGAAPAHLQRLFQEFEEMVEGQVFSLADLAEEKIAALRLRVAFANGTEAAVEDLQVYPSTKRVSFRVRQASAATRGSPHPQR